MKIIECNTDAEIAATYPLMQQLYHDIVIPRDQYVAKVKDMFKRSYRMIAAIKNEKYLGAVLFFYLSTFDAGDLPYVQDFIVDEQHRRRGIGTLLLGWISDEARKRGCKYISLNAEKMDKHAQDYYHRVGYEIDAYYFIKKL